MDCGFLNEGNIVAVLIGGTWYDVAKADFKWCCPEGQTPWFVFIEERMDATGMIASDSPIAGPLSSIQAVKWGE